MFCIIDLCSFRETLVELDVRFVEKYRTSSDDEFDKGGGGGDNNGGGIGEGVDVSIGKVEPGCTDGEVEIKEA